MSVTCKTARKLVTIRPEQVQIHPSEDLVQAYVREPFAE